MKKLNFWLLASLFVAAFALSACGSDDDDTSSSGDNPGTPTSIEGKWVGEWAAKPESEWKGNWDGLMWRYAHKLYYTINADKTFEIIESACWYSTDSSDKEYDKPSLSFDPARPKGAYLVERISHHLRGKYTLSDNNKITLDVDHEAWGSTDVFDDKNADYELTWSYTISGNKLKIGDGSVIPVSPHSLIAYDEMTWQGK